MTIRPILIALSLTAAALAPAAALARESDTRDLAGRLSDPQAQLAASAALAAMAEALLDIDVTPLTRAMASMGGGTMRDLPPDTRLRDLAGPAAEHMPSEIARNVPRAMGSVAGMAGAVDDMMPQLRETARRLKDAIPTY